MAERRYHSEMIIAAFVVMGVAGVLGVLIGKTTKLPLVVQTVCWAAAGFGGALLARRFVAGLPRTRPVVATLLVCGIVCAGRYEHGTPLLAMLAPLGAVAGAALATAMTVGAGPTGFVVRALGAGSATFGGVVLGVGLMSLAHIGTFAVTGVVCGTLAAALISASVDITRPQLSLGAAVVLGVAIGTHSVTAGIGAAVFGLIMGALGDAIGCAIRRSRARRIEVPEARRVS